MTQIPETGEDIPKWDVALEALAREECKKLGAALNMNDFKKLSQIHSIRFDDIMVTMFELVLNNKWSYQSSDKEHHGITQHGITQHGITRDEVNRLYVNGRLKDKDVEAYTGQWNPK